MMANLGMRIYDRENRLHTQSGETLRASALRRAREQAAKEGLTPVGEPRVERIDDGPAYGTGWVIEWDEALPQ